MTPYNNPSPSIKVEPGELKPVIAVQDDSCHWYVIPEEMSEEWYRLNAIMDDGEEGQVAFEKAEDEFIEKFSQYMTGGDLNNIQLYAKLPTGSELTIKEPQV